VFRNVRNREKVFCDISVRWDIYIVIFLLFFLCAICFIRVLIVIENVNGSG